MPRFTISHHDHPEDHWDFFLEDGEQLLTWRLDRPLETQEPISARALPSHRRIYLDYTGPVSGNRGNVALKVTGQFEWQIGDRNASTIRLRLTSDGINGICEFRQIEADAWECRFQETPTPTVP